MNIVAIRAVLNDLKRCGKDIPERTFASMLGAILLDAYGSGEQSLGQVTLITVGLFSLSRYQELGVPLVDVFCRSLEIGIDELEKKEAEKVNVDSIMAKMKEMV